MPAMPRAGVIILVSAVVHTTWALAQSPVADLHGVWIPQSYHLADGDTLAVTGHIFFTGEHWTVLFFVMQNGEPVRGSAEGGTYERTDDRLVFTHLHHLSVGAAVGGLPEAPLRMETRGAAGAPTEPTRVTIWGEHLTLFFPSGNSMTFRRR